MTLKGPDLTYVKEVRYRSPDYKGRHFVTHFFKKALIS